ncbi:hypothetical protein Tco_0398720, partial [Tanacetum coccineum]
LSGATWRRYCSVTVTGVTTGPSVNDGQWRQSTVANDGQRRHTTVGPPPDHRQTTVGPPVNHWSTMVDGQSTGGSGQVLGQVRAGLDRVGSGSATWCHVSADVAWRGFYPPVF